MVHKGLVTIDLKSKFFPSGCKTYAMSAIGVVKLNYIGCICFCDQIIKIGAIQYIEKIGVLVQSNARSIGQRRNVEHRKERNKYRKPELVATYQHRSCGPTLQRLYGKMKN